MMLYQVGRVSGAERGSGEGKKARKLYPIVELAGRIGWTKKIRADA